MRTPTNWRSFPTEYTTLLHSFARSPPVVIGPMDRRDARTAARGLARFRDALRTSLAIEPENEHVSELLEIAQSCVVRVFCPSDSDTTTEWYVELALSPI